MVFWWTRKPLASARAVIAGCLLPEDIDVNEFVRALRFNEKVVHRHNPVLPEMWKKYFSGKRLLDPFAGFGSIPLEGLRLGSDITAVELLPVAYVILKAVLEYPTKYGEWFVRDVEKWGLWVTERLREDPLIKEIYEDDVAVHIGSWEIKCPHCGRWTPLVGNWWLARVKADEGYARLAWMEPVIDGDKVKIKVVDLNKVLGDKVVEKAQVSGLKITAAGEEFRVPESNIEARKEKAICLLCHQPIMQIDQQTGKHYSVTKSLPNEVKERLKGYAKFALELFNKGIGYGTNSDIPQWVNEIPARQRLLVKVKVKDGDLEFESCTEKDQEKLEIARKEILKMLEANDPDIPEEVISPYSVRYLFPILYGMTEWYKLFNPRQLLILVKLVKLIREAGKQIEQEKVKEGLSEEEAFKYAETVTTCLGIALMKFVDYNTLVNLWNPGSWSWNKVAHSLSMRGIAMQWNWCEISPSISLPLSYTGTIKNTIDGLSYLVSTIHNISSNLLGKEQAKARVKVLLDDATVLSKLDSEERFDLIVTDPPYYDDVPYTELSDFYFVWLKRALSESQDSKLVPRFHREAFFKEIDGHWIEIRTQWEEFATREVSLNPPRLGENSELKDAIAYFQSLLDASFMNMNSLLKEDGLLVTYYAHTNPDAWKALLKSGWEVSGLTVSNAFPITTESAQSVVKRGKLSLDTSIVVVWRKGASGSIQASKLYEQMIEATKTRTRSAIEMKIHGRDLWVGALAAALSEATKFKEIIEMKNLDTAELMDKYVLRATLHGLTEAISQKAQVEQGVRSNEGMLYLVIKFLYSGSAKKIVTSDDARIFSLGTGVDLSYAINSLRLFRAGSEEEEGVGSSLAKRKTLVLLDPQTKDRIRLKDLLDYRGLDTEAPNIRCSIDTLHILEYYALTYPRQELLNKITELKTKFPAEVDEAISLARVISGSLVGDIERDLCNILIEKTMIKTLTEYPGGS